MAYLRPTATTHRDTLKILIYTLNPQLFPIGITHLNPKTVFPLSGNVIIEWTPKDVWIPQVQLMEITA